MQQANKSRLLSIITGISLNNLYIAIISFFIATIFALNLFELPTASLMPISLMYDANSMDSNIVFDYFFNLSHILSSIFVVTVTIFFLASIVILVNSYFAFKETSSLILLACSFFAFYLCISTFTPYIHQIEDKYLSSSNIIKSAYNGDYNNAYATTQVNVKSETELTYMNAQISLQEYTNNPTPNSQYILNSYSKALNLLLEQDAKNGDFFDANIIFNIYKASTNKNELTELKPFVQSVYKMTYIYTVLLLLFISIGLYRIFLHRKVIEN